MPHLGDVHAQVEQVVEDGDRIALRALAVLDDQEDDDDKRVRARQVREGEAGERGWLGCDE